MEAENNESVATLVPSPRPALAATTPAALLQLAIEHGAGVEQLERLLALQERWEATEARKAYVTAMAAFKRNPPELIKDSFVKSTKSARTGKYSASYYHASLAEIVGKCTPVLAEHGLHVDWDYDQTDMNSVTVSCVVTHESGHEKRVTLIAPPDTTGGKNSIQAVGSTTTYLRRYTLEGALGLAPVQDDDGRASEQRIAEPPPAKAMPDDMQGRELTELMQASDDEGLSVRIGRALKAAQDGTSDRATIAKAINYFRRTIADLKQRMDSGQLDPEPGEPPEPEPPEPPDMGQDDPPPADEPPPPDLDAPTERMIHRLETLMAATHTVPGGSGLFATLSDAAALHGRGQLTKKRAGAIIGCTKRALKELGWVEPKDEPEPEPEPTPEPPAPTSRPRCAHPGIKDGACILCGVVMECEHPLRFVGDSGICARCNARVD